MPCRRRRRHRSSPPRPPPRALLLLTAVTLTIIGGRSSANADRDSPSSPDSSDDPCAGGACPAPSSQQQQQQQQQQQAGDGGKTCNLWLGPSPIKQHEEHGFGLGVFTGRRIPRGSTVEGWDGGEILLPVYDTAIGGKGHHPPLREYVWNEDNIPEVQIDNLGGWAAGGNGEKKHKHTKLFVPGLASIAACTSKNNNIAMIGRGTEYYDELRDRVTILDRADGSGAHRSTDPTAGSFSYFHNVTYVAVRDIVPGEELSVDCSDDDFDGGAYYLETYRYDDNAVVCVDDLYVGPSSLQSQSNNRDDGAASSANTISVSDDANSAVPMVAGRVGRGAFTRRALSEGEVITSTPLIPVHRNLLDMPGTRAVVGDNDDASSAVGVPRKRSERQLLLNYCFGHPNSDLLLLPYGQTVNYINHAPGVEDVNAVIRWHPADNASDNDSLPRRQQHHHPELFDVAGEDVAEVHGKGLMMDVVATRDIRADEEILISYGRDWTDAWADHVADWRKRHEGSAEHGKYISAADYAGEEGGGTAIVRTAAEQEGRPYPSNLHTVCYHHNLVARKSREQLKREERGKASAADDDNRVSRESWNDHRTHKCLRPCTVLDRYEKGGKGGGDGVFYTVHLSAATNDLATRGSHCRLDYDAVVTDVPRSGIVVADRPYTSDAFWDGAFRHEIGVPDGFYPDRWMRAKVRRRRGDNSGDQAGEGDEFKRKKAASSASEWGEEAEHKDDDHDKVEEVEVEVKV